MFYWSCDFLESCSFVRHFWYVLLFIWYVLLNQKKQLIKDNYKELKKKKKIIRYIRKVDKLNEKIKKGVNIKKEWKKKSKPKIKSTKKMKSFDEYFQECIKNKEIPEDTPSYFREALERAIKEYNQGVVKEKSNLLKNI